ncbi:MAG: hypothetical protein QOH06_5444 [Acidobacteriota bacterium]|jgi:trans-aconitate methyltransferase|nr:hypothetical protein [Acidobacteriota bacterium]
MCTTGKDFWNKSGHLFKGTTSATEDNQAVAWPALQRELEKLPKKDHLRVLDFGCGAGQLSHLLGKDNRYEIVGLDPAANMISQANEQATQGVTFVEGTICNLASMRPFDAIVSSMVFQFVNEVGSYFRRLEASLRAGGALAFVVFNPAFIGDQLKTKTDLFAIDQCGCLQMILEGRPTPVYSRSASDYEAFLTKAGFALPSAYVKPYHQDNCAERFLIISCKKS